MSLYAREEQRGKLGVLMLTASILSYLYAGLFLIVQRSCQKGHDTTAAALVYLLMLLAENKEAQNLARAEVYGVFNESEGKITHTEIQKLNYLERCVKESMRLFPSVPHIARHISEEMRLKNYTIPKGQELVISIFDVHRNPKYWTDPDKFIPDRFLPENSKERHPNSYIPFSGGPRNCIGQKLAMFELMIVAAHILYNFNLEPIDKTADLKFKLHVVLTTTHPVYIKFIGLNRN